MHSGQRHFLIKPEFLARGIDEFLVCMSFINFASYNDVFQQIRAALGRF